MANEKNGKEQSKPQPKPPKNPPPRPMLKLVTESYDLLKALRREKEKKDKGK
jgi:hypothetical protein